MIYPHTTVHNRVMYIPMWDFKFSRRRVWCSELSSGMMMEAVRTSETSVDNYFTRQDIPEDNSEQCIYLLHEMLVR
jgi:hypothetical protein